MTIKYTKEQLNKFDKDLLIELFLGMQGQMEELSRQTQALNDRMQLMMEPVSYTHLTLPTNSRV